MSKTIALPFIVAFSAASIIASVLVLLTSVAPPASAEPEPPVAQASARMSPGAAPLQAQGAAAGLTGRACSARSWPNYDQGCQFDLRPSGDAVRPVRMLDLEIRAKPGRPAAVVASGYGR
jgi:hypothetical protein